VTSELHPEIRQVIQSPTAEVALRLASVAASTPSAIWTDQAWLTVAAGANSAAISDSRWMALCIFAYEKRAADVAVVDAPTPPRQGGVGGHSRSAGSAAELQHRSIGEVLQPTPATTHHV
jgi:hypothetical protein